MINYIYLTLGVSVLNLLRLNEDWGKPKFTWKSFFKENGIPAIVALIFGTVLILTPGGVEGFESATPSPFGFKINGMFMFGMMADVIVKKAIAAFTPSKNTVVGINKKKEVKNVDNPSI